MSKPHQEAEMKLIDVHNDLKDKYNFEVIAIQSGGFYEIILDGAELLHEELNLKFMTNRKVAAVGFPTNSIEQYIAHLKLYNHTYAFLETKKEERDDKLLVKKSVIFSSNQLAIDDFYNWSTESKSLKVKKIIVSGNDHNPRNLTKKYSNAGINTESSFSHNIELTDEQQSTLNEIKEWLKLSKGSERIAILKGKAGTGKTTLLKSVVEYIEKQKKTYSLIAFTGRAARVLSNKTGYSANTIHSEIYSIDKNSMAFSEDNEEQQLKFEESDFSVSFSLKDTDELKQYYIVDEASMVGDKNSASGNLNFGSGKVLTDLLTQIGIINRKNVNTKILFVGDEAQLPPINENSSPALSKMYFAKEYNLSSKVFSLKTVMRQKEGSHILKNAEYIRKQIEIRDFKKFNIDHDGKTVTETNQIRLIKEMLDTNRYKDRVVVVNMNRTAYQFNRAVRSKRFGIENKDNILPGDIIVVGKATPLAGSFSNGDVLEVVSVKDREERSLVLKKSKEYHNNPKEIKLCYRDIVVKPIEVIGDSYNKKVKIIENLLDKPDAYLSPEEIIAQHIDWNQQVKDKKLTTEEQKEDFINNSYLNALHVKYAYAMTCHKAQGGEWDNVTVWFDRVRQDESFYRWAYTAVTRAQYNLQTMYAPMIEKKVIDELEDINAELNRLIK
jgi:hypothetical protein